MVDINRNMLVACVVYLAAFSVAYVAVGSRDVAIDAAMLDSSIAQHDAERSLSVVYDVSVVLGMLSLWIYDARSWKGGAAVGLVTAMAAGGLHVGLGMGAWYPLAFILGYVGAFMLAFLANGRPVVCALFSIEVALAVLQAAFLIVNV